VIRDLENEGLRAFDPKRPKRPLSASSVENYCTPLAGVLAFAVRRGYVGSNPFLALTNDDRPEKRDVEPAHEWDDSEINALVEASELLAAKPQSQYDYSLLIRTAVFTGLRLGELLGLQWGDLDFEEGVLHVRRQATRTGELAPPKTKKGVRRVPLEPDLVKRLRLHRLASKHSQEGDLVFPAQSGRPLSHRNVQRRAFEPARDLAELPKTVTFHDLRHAFASLAAHRGVPVNVLSEVMGHSDVGVTQKVYMHLYGREQAEDAFRKAMAGGAS
jgi:integrase